MVGPSQVAASSRTVLRRVGHRGRAAADDPGDARRRGAGADHQVLRRELTVDAEKIDDVFAGRGPAHHHVRGLVTAGLDESIEVEGMERLAELMQHEVGDVDDVVDRPQPDGAEPLAQPPRRGAHGDAFDDPSSKARAALGVLDADLGAQLGRRRREQLRGHGRRRFVERLAECGRELACDADMAEAVRPVGGHLEVEDGVEGQHLAKGLTRAALVEDEDAVRVLPHAELDRRAEHARATCGRGWSSRPGARPSPADAFPAARRERGRRP